MPFLPPNKQRQSTAAVEVAENFLLTNDNFLKIMHKVYKNTPTKWYELWSDILHEAAVDHSHKLQVDWMLRELLW